MSTLGLATSLILAASSGPVTGDGTTGHPAAPAPTAKSHSVAKMNPHSPLHRSPKQVTHFASGSPTVEPTTFLPLIIGSVVMVPLPGPVNLVWEQTHIVDPFDGWSELVYQVPQGGSSLLVAFDNPIQFDFAEIVYQDGTAQTVDLGGPARNPGSYLLANLDPSRFVDHVRVIAQASDSVAYLRVLAR